MNLTEAKATDTAAYLRQVYIDTKTRGQFIMAVMKPLNVDVYTAELFWELIDIIGDLGVKAEVVRESVGWHEAIERIAAELAGKGGGE